MPPDPLRLLAAALALLAGCTSLRRDPLDAARPPRDAGADTSRPDAGPHDAGPDAGFPDAAPPSDGGQPPIDAGPCSEPGSVTPLATTFAALGTYDPACSQTASDVLSCMRASRAFCLGRACAATGMGALRAAPDTTVACLGGVIVEMTDSYDQLSMHDIVFDDSSARTRMGQVAVHRYCRARGYAVGIGPMVIDALRRSARLACVPTGRGAEVPVMFVQAVAAGCNPTEDPDTLACSAFANERCTTFGWEAGIGPADWDTSFVYLACVGDR
jgi:hypothetical protein